MLKYIPVVATEPLSPAWFLEFATLGACAIIEGYTLDIIEISGAVTEAEYYAR